MAFGVRTLSVPTTGTLVRKGAGSVTLVNRDAAVAMLVAASQAGLGAAGTRDSIEAGKSISVTLSGRKDEIWVASAAGTINVAVYEV